MGSLGFPQQLRWTEDSGDGSQRPVVALREGSCSNHTTHLLSLIPGRFRTFFSRLCLLWVTLLFLHSLSTSMVWVHGHGLQPVTSKADRCKEEGMGPWYWQFLFTICWYAKAFSSSFFLKIWWYDNLHNIFSKNFTQNGDYVAWVKMNFIKWDYAIYQLSNFCAVHPKLVSHNQ